MTSKSHILDCSDPNFLTSNIRDIPEFYLHNANSTQIKTLYIPEKSRDYNKILHTNEQQGNTINIIVLSTSCPCGPVFSSGTTTVAT